MQELDLLEISVTCYLLMHFFYLINPFPYTTKAAADDFESSEQTYRKSL